MTGADALQLLNYQLKDFQDAVYSPFEKMNAINAANRMARKAAAKYKSSLVMVTETQNLVVGDSTYTLTHIPNKVTEVRVDGKVVKPIARESITDLTTTGTPTNYWLSAYNEITFYPVPKEVLSFDVTMVEASTDWTEATTIPWSPDLVDVIVSGAYSILTGTDVSGMIKELVEMLSSVEPDSREVVGYWNTRTTGGEW